LIIGYRKPFFWAAEVQVARSSTVHPRPSVRCEHMFPSLRTFALAQRALAAFRLTGSFLLLEDDDRVDWEVDGSEPAGARPDRAPLRERIAASRLTVRRAGQPVRAAQVCVSPVDGAAPVTRRRRRPCGPCGCREHARSCATVNLQAPPRASGHLVLTRRLPQRR